VKAFVLGLDHRIQFQDDEGRLLDLIGERYSEHKFDLIAEEWGTTDTFDNTETIGKQFADSFPDPIEWINIEMPEALKKSIGILAPLNARSRPSFNEWTLEPIITIPQTTYLKCADRIRENYWVNEISKRLPKESILVMCGHIHVETLCAKLAAEGFIVKSKSLCECPWYRSRHEPTCVEIEKHIVDDQY
jgi:hypothetical protein